jgi:hypothetical protein
MFPVNRTWAATFESLVSSGIYSPQFVPIVRTVTGPPEPVACQIGVEPDPFEHGSSESIFVRERLEQGPFREMRQCHFTFLSDTNYEQIAHLWLAGTRNVQLGPGSRRIPIGGEISAVPNLLAGGHARPDEAVHRNPAKFGEFLVGAKD